MAVEPGLYTEIVTDNSEFDRRMQRSKKIAEQMGYGLDGLGRIGVRAARDLQKTNAALRDNRRAAIDAQRTMVQLENTYLDIGDAASRTAQRVTQNTRGFRLMRGQLYNASIQAQDFAVQVGAGTSAMTAFSQNAPQFLSVLGPQFAAIGALIAALPLLVVGYKSLTGAVGDFTDEVERSRTAVDEYKAALDKMLPEFETRLAKFTTQLKASREELEDLAALAERRAVRSLRDMSQAFADLTTEAGFFQKLMANTDRTVVGDLINVDTTLRGHLGTWYEAHDQVEEFIDLVRGIAEADSMDAMLELATAARDAFKENVDITQELTADQEAFLQQISELILKLREMGAIEQAKVVPDDALDNMADLRRVSREYAESRIAGEAQVAAAAKAAARAALADQLYASREYAESRMAADKLAADSREAAAKEQLQRAKETSDAEYALGVQLGEALRKRQLAEYEAGVAAREKAEAQAAHARLTIAERTADQERLLGEQMVEAMERFRREEIERTAKELDILFRARTISFSIRFAREEALMDMPVAPAGGKLDPGKSYEEMLAMGWSPEALERIGMTPPREGGGAGVDPMMSQIEQLRQSLLTQEQLELESYERRRQLLEDFLMARPEQLEQYNSMMEALEQQHADRMAKIDAYRYGDTLDKTGAFLGDMASIMAQGNDKMLRISKVFGAAQALISTYQGAAEELKKGVFGFATAAAVIAKGMGFVAAIQGVNKGGTTTGGAAAPGAAAAAAPPAVSRNVAIQLTGGDMFSRDQVINLINSINEAVEDGAQVRLV